MNLWERDQGVNDAMRFLILKTLTILAQRNVEETVRGARRASRAEALVFRVLLNRSKHVRRWSESVSGNSVSSFNLMSMNSLKLVLMIMKLPSYLFVEFQGKKTTQVLIVDVENCVLLNVRWENGTI